MRCWRNEPGLPPFCCLWLEHDILCKSSKILYRLLEVIFLFPNSRMLCGLSPHGFGVIRGTARPAASFCRLREPGFRESGFGARFREPNSANQGPPCFAGSGNLGSGNQGPGNPRFCEPEFEQGSGILGSGTSRFQDSKVLGQGSGNLVAGP